MRSQEKDHLTQLVMYEAAKRYIQSFETSERADCGQKYQLIENLITAIENTELSFLHQGAALLTTTN